MLYMIYGEDASDSLARRAAASPAHLERIEELVACGRLVLAGPLPSIDAPDPGPAGMAGSLVVAEFDSLEAARLWIDGDPYVTEGVFRSVTVRPFEQVPPT
jgi:uncharacterized protein YciI